MLEAGPLLTERPGVHVKNIADRDARRRAQLRSQGPDADLTAEVPDGVAAAGHPSARHRAHRGRERRLPRGRDLDERRRDGRPLDVRVPAAWRRRAVPFLPASELDEVLARAEGYLSVRRDVFAGLGRGPRDPGGLARGLRRRVASRPAGRLDAPRLRHRPRRTSVLDRHRRRPRAACRPGRRRLRPSPRHDLPLPRHRRRARRRRRRGASPDRRARAHPRDDGLRRRATRCGHRSSCGPRRSGRPRSGAISTTTRR